VKREKFGQIRSFLPKMKSTAFLISVVLTFTTFFFACNLNAQSYGLVFASREVVPEKRTSVDLTRDENICFSDKIALSFDIAFNPEFDTYFGYIFRIINDKNQNIDLLYDQHKREFKIIFLDAYTSVSLPLTISELVSKWHSLRVEIDSKKGLSLYYQNKLVRTTPLNFSGNCLKICFGANSYAGFKSIDVPYIRLKNIGIDIDDKPKYFWPLNESSGNTITDSIQSKKVTVLNPTWINPKHSNWALVSSLLIKGPSSVAFSAAEDLLYIVSSDSLYSLPVKTDTIRATPLKTRHDNLLLGNQSIYNRYDQRLYNFYIDQHRISEYNFTDAQWDQNFAPGPPTEYWHVNKFFSKSDSALYVIGGYGQLRYKNLFQRYNLVGRNWETVPVKGDYFTPRYLSGLGATANGDTAYILGGYGSKNGDQLLNPKYIYELSRFDTRSGSVKKLFSLKEPAEPFVFANSLIIDSADKSYYGLIFPKDKFNTNLQLIKGSLLTPAYELLGAPFPYSFYDNKSFADLYYSSVSRLLIGVTFYTSLGGNTEVKIYKINFPPNKLSTVVATNETAANHDYLYLILSILAGGILVFTFWKRFSRKSVPEAVVAPAAAPIVTPIPAAPAIAKAKAQIFLFGNFEVITAGGEKLTKSFTPLLKELFLLLTIDSIRYDKGVSAEKLNETLWYDRHVKDAINNRSVNIAKLKNILEKTEGCTINKASGYWKLDFDENNVQVDLARYVHVFSGDIRGKESVNELISITQRGPFLPQTDYQWLDNIKSEISNFIIDTLLKYCQMVPLAENAESIIAICDSIFFFDESNEIALKLKCRSLVALGRHTLAKNTFEKFNIKYHEIYGEDYKESYASVIGGGF
jgi:DNA-binding SARP family transcriptional activator